MNDVVNILKKYFDNRDIKIALKDISNKKRTIIINDNYFAKLSVKENSIYCNNFINEINLYNKNQSVLFFPRIVDYLMNNDFCLLVLRKIEAKTIGRNRNEFKIDLNIDERKRIIEKILEIKNISVDFELDNSYSRKEKLDLYLKKTKEYISEDIRESIDKLRDFIVKEEHERVLSHGDLISTNIMLDGNNVYFLDWEYVSMKPLYYDLVYFLLFSKEDNALDILYDNELKSIDKNDAFKDGIIVCLKEINENAKLYGTIEKDLIDKNIRRWEEELAKIIEKMSKNE